MQLSLQEAAFVVGEEPWRSLTLFLFLLLGGETTLVPAMGLAVAGWVEVWRVFLLLAAATVVSDVLWYLSGRFVDALPVRRVWGIGWVVRRVDARLAPLLQAHPAKVVFLSKFVFGARATVQFLCGMYRIPLYRYLLASLGGVLVWALVIWLLLARVGRWVPLEESVRWFSLVVGGVLLLVVGLHLLVKRLWWRAMLREGEGN